VADIRNKILGLKTWIQLGYLTAGLLPNFSHAASAVSIFHTSDKMRMVITVARMTDMERY
jgi:hypothetical protein